MSVAIAAKPLSLKKDNDGVFRVGGTRVTLDTIIAAFNDGATAEEIVYQYPSLNLADVYEVIGYYLRNRSETEAYLKHRQNEAFKIRQQNENLFDPQGIRDRLMARRSLKKIKHMIYYNGEVKNETRGSKSIVSRGMDRF